MRPHLPRLAALASSLPLVLLSTASEGLAQWSQEPSEHVTVAAMPDNSSVYRLIATADGGAWVLWPVLAAGALEVRAQRFDAAGFAAFGPAGLTVLDMDEPFVVDFGGVETASGDLVVSALANAGAVLQRVGPAGTLRFAPAGLPVPEVFADRCLVALEDDVVVAGHSTQFTGVVAQRFDRTGAEVWSSWVALPTFAFTGFGLDADATGVVVAGHVPSPNSTGRALVAQRIDAQGGLPWGSGGVQVSGSAPLAWGFDAPRVRCTGAGGAVFAYPVALSALVSDLFVQRLDPAGSVVYGPFGLPVSTLVQGRGDFDLAYDDVSDGAVVAWWELELAYPPSATPASLRVQNIDAAGTRRLGPTGREVSDGGVGSATMDTVRLALGQVGPTSAGRSVFVAFGHASDDALYGGRLDASGAWVTGRVTVHDGDSPPFDLQLVAARAGEHQSLLAWLERTPSGRRVIRLQNLRGDGGLGGPVGLGWLYCEGGPNSLGARATLHAAGSAVVARNLFTLQARAVPPQQVGVFLFAPSAGFTPQPGGSPGDLCLSRPIGRSAPRVADSAGRLDQRIDLTAVPTPTGSAAVLAGESWHFQAWYREGASQGNYSGGLRVSFL